MACSGARWKDLPELFGSFQTVNRRYYRWLERDLIDGIKPDAALADRAYDTNR